MQYIVLPKALSPFPDYFTSTVYYEFRRNITGVEGVNASATSTSCAAEGSVIIVVGRGGGHQNDLLRATCFVRLQLDVGEHSVMTLVRRNPGVMVHQFIYNATKFFLIGASARCRKVDTPVLDSSSRAFVLRAHA